MKRIIYLLTFILLACNNNSKVKIKEKKFSENESNLNSNKTEKEDKRKSQEELDLIEYYKTMLIPYKDSFEGFKFKFGYYKYDEDKFGFDNPGYLEVFKNGKLIYKDKFSGEGPLYVKSLGYHNLSGRKLMFSFNYGTEACDYNSYEKFYFVNSNDKITYINQYYSSSGGDGYATHFYDEIFPEDSLGVENSLLIVEGLKFHQHDQEDRFDTTKILFKNNSFKLKKTTNNLDKAK